MSTAVLGLAAHATQFVVLFAVPGTLLLWRAFQTGQRGPIFFSGLLYGLAFVMKQPGVVFGVFGLLVLLWRERREAAAARDSVRRIFWYGLGLALPFGGVCAYLAAAGVFPQFWFWTFSYAQAYATGTPLGEGLGYLLDYLRDQSAFFAGFWLLAGAGLLVALRRGADQQRMIFALLFLFCSFLGTMPGLYFRQHYFVLLLPAFAVVVGLAVGFLQSTPGRWMKTVPVILLAAVLAWDVYLQRWAFFRFPPATLNQIIYGANPFVESVVAAKYLREHSAPDARVAVIGSEPQIYFYANRRSATGYLYTYPLMEDQPYALTMQHRMISEIESKKPEYLLIVVNRYSWLAKESSNLGILAWAKQYAATNYDRVGIVDERLGQPEIQLWGDAAKNYPGQLEQFLDLYKRKPQAD